MNRIRVLVVDDHSVVREGVKLVLEQRADIAVVGMAGDMASALDAYRRLAPDVVLVDLHLPDASGTELVARLRARAPNARLCVLSAFESRADIDGALAAGARGYVVKAAPAEEIVDAVRRVHAGLRAVDARLFARSRTAGPDVLLSPRELGILRRVAAGGTNRQIAGVLRISLSTVKFHLHRLMKKLGARDRTEAAAIALREGIIRD